MLKIKKDINGNKTVFVKVGNHRGFSIQTNGILPILHKYPIGEIITKNEYAWYELESVVHEIGSNNQISIVNEYIVENFYR